MLTAQPNGASAVQRVRWIALIAAELMSAVGEYHLAVEIGIVPALAWLLPVGLGVYGFCAFATGKRADVFAALGLMIVCQAMAHLLAIGLVPRHWALVIAASAVAPIVCWRVHHLGQNAAASMAPESNEVDSDCLCGSGALAGAERPEGAEEMSRESADEPLMLPGATPRTAGAVRRTRSEWRAAAEAVWADEPELSRKSVAAKLGCSDRWLRTCLNAA
ncbi:hypothetical protein Val02_69390 [Virgisporangium aliadipatigenens]|uniref:DUF2637 domain-containing protein n=1 Tax=Virgisporangium aliadipatigenens TaxID=741659 RepID=A0A8J4DUH2_9ACTN|nr:hypothetical protein [Virgisporangium aliadipatigenens]GIJ50053.1 hypothetical protein Val02_69390 [Virgisporangium aliadipatigenens]